jgi:hypothetical protein
MSNLGTFDFRKVSIIFGIAKLTGFAEEAITIKEKNPAFNSDGGADGHVDRVKNNNNSLIINLSLRATSPTNDILSAIHAADRIGNVPLPMLIKDRSGNTMFAAKQAWIVNFAEVKMGNNVVSKDWEIHTGSDYSPFVGGNI